MERNYEETDTHGVTGSQTLPGNPELNKPCKKRICKYNTNAVEKLCDCTKEKKYALKFGQKAKTKAYTPGQNK